MNFKYIKKLKPFVILAMILIFMPIVTKAGNLVPSTFNGFAVTGDGLVIIGDNIAVTGWKNNEKQFSFPVSFSSDYALSVNQDDNIVIYTENAKFIFSQDGTPLTVNQNSNINIEELKTRQVITLNNGTSYILLNRFGIKNTIVKVQDGNKTTEYTTPVSELFVEFAFWEGNLILLITSVAILLDVRKRRFVQKKKPETENKAEEKPKKEIELPKFLKAFTKPEIQNKGASFSSEYSTKPGERPRFLDSETEKTKENDTEKTTDSN